MWTKRKRFGWPATGSGEIGFEFMESTTPDGEVAKFIEKRGEGVMLISFNVDNTREAVAELQGKGLSFYPGFQGRNRPVLSGLRVRLRPSPETERGADRDHRLPVG